MSLYIRYAPPQKINVTLNLFFYEMKEKTARLKSLWRKKSVRLGCIVWDSLFYKSKFHGFVGCETRRSLFRMPHLITSCL